MQRRGLVADPLLRHTENMWNIQEALDWLAGLEFFGVKLGLEQTRELFRRIGSPERKLRFIHIAGSNGKGSTGAFLESALRNAGFRTGFYSSPHLVDVNERFMINGVPVDDNRLAEALDKIRSAADAMKNENGMRVTYFEATTAAAALLFAGAEADFAVWETGMGGRLDATSIVTPVATVITTISMEHKEYLGDTIGKIAFEKAAAGRKQLHEKHPPIRTIGKPPHACTCRGLKTRLVHRVGQKRDGTGALDSLGQLTLMLRAVAAHAAGQNLAALIDETAQAVDVLVINVFNLIHAEGADLPTGTTTSARTRTTLRAFFRHECDLLFIHLKSQFGTFSAD